MRLAGHAVLMEYVRNSYKILAEKRERKKLIGKHRSRLEDNIKININVV
jgi:hypothetical protein